jgi:CubicO group peptidase (beta-lactamase class C family)
MMKSRIISLSLVGLILLMIMARLAPVQAAEASDSAQAAGPAVAPSVESFVDNFVNERMEQAHVPGLAIAVVYQGELVLAKGYGYADLAARQPMTAQTNLRAGSVSKPVTSAAVLQLVERGLLELDSPVSRYLPDLPLEDRFGPPSTIAQLLALKGGYADVVLESHAPAVDTWQPLGDYLAANLPPRAIQPGVVYSYNSWEHTLLGYTMERVTGSPYDRVIAENLFAPLGMDHSTFTQPLPEPIAANLASGYSYQDGGFEDVPLDYVQLSPGAALVTTAKDMSRLIVALLNGGELEGTRILNEETTRLILTRQDAVHPASRARTYGLSEITLEGRRAVYHDGNGIGFGNRLLLVPEHKFGVFISVNHRPLAFDAGPTTALRFVQDLSKALVVEYLPPSDLDTLSGEPLPDAAGRAPRYTGQYRLAGTPRTDFFKVGALLDYVDVKDNRDGALSIGSGSYAEIEPLVFQHTEDPGRVVVFVENQAGQITLLTFGGTGSYEKVEWYETSQFHMAMVALLLVSFLSFAVSWPIRRRGPWLLWAVSLINLAFLVGFGLMLVQADLILFFKNIPTGVHLLLSLPILSAVLALGLPVVLVRIWRQSVSRWTQVHHTLVGVAAVGFLWFAFYWNLYLI